MNERGILLSTEGPHHNVLKLKPPMVFRPEDVDLFMAVFAERSAGYCFACLIILDQLTTK